MRLTRVTHLFLATVVFVAAGCDYMNSSVAPPAAPGITGATSPATYQQVAAQILQPKCYSCHTGEETPNLSSWAAFAQDTRYIIPGNPGQSDLYLQASSGNMPKDGSALSQSELKLLSDWISAGAQND